MKKDQRIMEYQEAIQYLYESQPVFHLVGAPAYKPGFDNVNALMSYLGNPHHAFRSVHIAGTNGKGSTSHLIAACLQAAGLKVGLYTSPHLVDFRERIRINGQKISEGKVACFVEENKGFLDELKPSFFETTVAMAFDFFAKEKVDVAVVEVGLGGRLDATNIITPLVSVITNIGMDHTDFLGNNLAQIAAEKAGIIKPGVPCVIGETNPETALVFIEAAVRNGIWGDGLETTNCKIWFADQCGYLRMRRKREITECELQGIYQKKNIQTAYVALQVLHSYFPLLTKKALSEGYAHVCSMTGLRGRWETLRKRPLTICDTGHNAHGIQYVVQHLKELQVQHPEATLHIVFGMVNDKDIDMVLALLPKDAVYYFTQAKTVRAIPAREILEKYISQSHEVEHANSETFFNSHCCASSYDTVDKAIQAAQKKATEQDIIFIGGSNYVVGEVLPLF